MYGSQQDIEAFRAEFERRQLVEGNTCPLKSVEAKTEETSEATAISTREVKNPVSCS